MSLVVGLSDLKPEQINRPGKVGPGNPGAVVTTFFKATADNPNSPSAYLNHYPGGKTRFSAAHFHEADQFQVIVQGKGKFGRHDVMPYCIHFSRAYTPYGPLLSDEVEGWTFLVLRTRYDPGAQRFPESQAALKQVPGRRPWQITRRAEFPVAGKEASVKDIPWIKDDQGLFAHTLNLAPHAQTVAPNPSVGEGQFVVVLKGSLVHDNTERSAPTVAFIQPDEPAFRIQAGANGLEGLILNFPRTVPRAIDAKSPSASAGFKKWQCELCAFAYDEALGMPEVGISAGTRWADVPESWTCPDCAAAKSDFQMVEV
jgi:rubredoxin